MNSRPLLESADHWNAVVDSLQVHSVLVVGDVMLDAYIEGEVRRVCPEAPVPVVESVRRWSCPGGAANAARNIAALGGQARLCGIVGADPAARELRERVRSCGVDDQGLLEEPSRPTTYKERILARGQQILRIDTEASTPIPHALGRRLVGEVSNQTETGAVLLSDYGKGAVTNIAPELIAVARRGQCPVIVDPKGSEPARYRGATIVKPNVTELSSLTGLAIAGEKDLVAAGEILAGLLPESIVLVTRGAEGMMVFRNGHTSQAFPTTCVQRVFDVTGAGDTAAAALTLTLAAGWPLEIAIHVANTAAGIVVTRSGTSAVSPAELRRALIEPH